MKTKTLSAMIVASTLALSASLAISAHAFAADNLSPPVTQNGVTTQSAAASEAFPGLKTYVNLPAAERSQFNIYYIVRIKHADPSQVKITLTDNGRSQPLSILADGRISPLPTRDQLNNGAKISISGPTTGTYAMKIRVYSPQPAGRTYDAAGLALGVKQGNSAMSKAAGAASFLLKKLDRVYFIGGGNGTIEVNGKAQALPRTAANGEYPAGTPYFVPAQMQGATRITLTATPSIVMLDTPSK